MPASIIGVTGNSMTFPRENCDLNFLVWGNNGHSYCMLTFFFCGLKAVAACLIVYQNLTKTHHPLSDSTVDALAIVPYAVACNCTAWMLPCVFHGICGLVVLAVAHIILCKEDLIAGLWNAYLSTFGDCF
jgi:hypothetical protein